MSEVKEFKVYPIKKYYINKFLSHYNKCENLEEFEEVCSAEEVAGYYIYFYKQFAYKTWCDNIKGRKLGVFDSKVDKILRKLYCFDEKSVDNH